MAQAATIKAGKKHALRWLYWTDRPSYKRLKNPPIVLWVSSKQQTDTLQQNRALLCFLLFQIKSTIDLLFSFIKKHPPATQSAVFILCLANWFVLSVHLSMERPGKFIPVFIHASQNRFSLQFTKWKLIIKYDLKGILLYRKIYRCESVYRLYSAALFLEQFSISRSICYTGTQHKNNIWSIF